MQIWAASALFQVSHRCAELENVIRKTPGEIVVSDLFFLPEMTPHLPQERLFLEVTGEKQTGLLLEKFAAGNVREFTLLLSPNYRRLPAPALTRLLQAYPPATPEKKYTITPGIEIFVVKCAKKP